MYNKLQVQEYTISKINLNIKNKITKILIKKVPIYLII
jgi:hypothetical protein